MRHCEKDLFATPKSKNTEFNTPMVWDLVKGLSKEPGTVSFQSYADKDVFTGVNLQPTEDKVQRSHCVAGCERIFASFRVNFWHSTQNNSPLFLPRANISH